MYQSYIYEGYAMRLMTASKADAKENILEHTQIMLCMRLTGLVRGSE